jgi:hypothetical protein
VLLVRAQENKMAQEILGNFRLLFCILLIDHKKEKDMAKSFPQHASVAK